MTIQRLHPTITTDHDQLRANHQYTMFDDHKSQTLTLDLTKREKITKTIVIGTFIGIMEKT
jgi:hypothetical protein